MAFQGPSGHGENIWVFAHRRTAQVIYSFQAKLDVCAPLYKTSWMAHGLCTNSLGVHVVWERSNIGGGLFANACAFNRDTTT